MDGVQRPIIRHGSKVSLGIILESDINFIFATINDPEVKRYLRAPYSIHTYGDEQKWISNLGSRESDMVFSIAENAEQSMVGLIGLHQLDFHNGTGYVGYVLSREHWNKGYVTEAVSLVVEFSFKRLNLRKLHSSVFEPNIGTMKVLLKNGFKESGRRSRHVFVEGHGYVDEILYELFNPDHA